MAISASKIVEINPRVIPAGSSELEIAGLFLTKNVLAPYPTVLQFDSKDAVRSYFGSDSGEYDLASKYFLGYDNSYAKPRVLYFARRADEALAAFIQGQAPLATLAQLKAVTNGSFKVTINGVEQTATGINLVAANSYSDVAATIQAKLPSGSSVTYSSLTRGFTVKTATKGSASSIGYFSPSGTGTDLSALLGLHAQSSALLSAGADALSAGAQMDVVTEQTRNFVTFTTVYEPSEDEALALAGWSSGQNVEYLYVLWSEAAQLTSQTAANTIAEKIKFYDYGGVTAVYGDAQYAAFIMGAAASIDWNRKNGAINFAFKSQTGLAATVTDGSAADVLLGRGFNYYGRFATRAEEFIFFYDGQMFGSYGFIDTYINTIWLRNVIQTALMQGLKQTQRAPYTEMGYALVRAWMTDPIERALSCGVIDAGVSMTAAQKAEVQQEAGMDISSDLYTKGYFLQVLDPGPQARVNRDSPIINLWYTYGGSINRLVVPVSAIL